MTSPGLEETIPADWELVHESELRRGEVVIPYFGPCAGQRVVTCGKSCKCGHRLATRNGGYFVLGGNVWAKKRYANRKHLESNP
jgi:hypothetical protein